MNHSIPARSFTAPKTMGLHAIGSIGAVLAGPPFGRSRPRIVGAGSGCSVRDAAPQSAAGGQTGGLDGGLYRVAGRHRAVDAGLSLPHSDHHQRDGWHGLADVVLVVACRIGVRAAKGQIYAADGARHLGLAGCSRGVRGGGQRLCGARHTLGVLRAFRLCHADADAGRLHSVGQARRRPIAHTCPVHCGFAGFSTGSGSVCFVGGRTSRLAGLCSRDVVAAAGSRFSFYRGIG